MNVLACFHVIPDYSCITQSQLDEIVDQKNLTYLDKNVQYFMRIISQYDESALEISLKIKDTLNESHISAVTINREENAAVLKKLLALPFNEITRIEPSRDIRFESIRKAELLVEHVQKTADIDVIVCGMQSGESNNGTTGFLLAHMLGWPCIRNVIDVEPLSNGQLHVQSKENSHISHYLVKKHAVLLIGNTTSSNLLRIATLKQKMAAKKRTIILQESTIQSLPNINVNSFNQQISPRKKVMIESGSDSEKATQAVALLVKTLEELK